MSIEIIQQKLKQYKCADMQEEAHAVREIAQEVILAGLARTDYFKHAAFHEGRDWYDGIWYLSQRTPVNYTLLQEQIHQIGPWQGQYQKVDQDWCFNELNKKIESLDWAAAKRDVMPFIKQIEQPSIELWGVNFFKALLDKYRT